MAGSEQRAAWRDPSLGTPREVELAQGTVRVFEAGDGPPVVFVHGLLVNANLWRKVVPQLADALRCISLDLPLGAHALAMPEAADLSPPALADLIADAIEALGLEDVTLVGNDTGGALAQILVTRRPERVGRLVLTSCDYRDNFPPPMFAYLRWAAAVPGALKALTLPMRLRPARRLPLAFGWLAKRPIDREAEDSYVLPGAALPGVERDVRRVLRAIDTRYTNEAADRLPEFERPALIAWAREDRFFKPVDAERLAHDLPAAQLEWIDDSLTFIPEDRPEALASLIRSFAARPDPGEGEPA